MRPSGLRIAAYRPEHARGLAEVQRHLWGPDPELNLAYLKWKYEQGPAAVAETPLLYVVLRDSAVVGMRGVTFGQWEVGEEPRCFEIPTACDLVLAPEHRERGLYSELMQHVLADLERRGFEYAFNLSATPANQLGSLAAGWKSIGSLRPVVLESGVSGGIRRLLRRPPFDRLIGPVALAYRASEKLRAGARSRLGGARRSRRLQIDAAPRPEAMAELIARLGTDGRIRQVRSPGYMAWRYRNPLARYRFVYREDDRLEGFLVLSTSKVHPARSAIVDWEGATPEIRAELLRAAIDLSGAVGTQVWSATLSAEDKESLAACGFAPEPPTGVRHADAAILVRRLGVDGAPAQWRLGGRALLDVGSWDVRMLSSDAC